MKLLSTLGFCIILLVSCTRAGKGGSSTLTVNVFIDSSRLCTECDVYIYYGDTSFSSDNPDQYDDESETDIFGQCSFRNLRRGEYSVYAYGNDPLFGDTVQVEGWSHEIIEDAKSERHITINTTSID